MGSTVDRLLGSARFGRAARMLVGNRLPAPLTELPEVENMERKWDGDRCLYEGYQRGFGLQFGKLNVAIWRDPLYQMASKLSEGRSIVSEPRRMNLFLLIRFFLKNLPSQNIIEFGTYRGGSAIFMAALLRELHPGAKLYALDTFEGMPNTDSGVDWHRSGDFQDSDYAQLQRLAAELRLDNLIFVKGLIQDTAAGVYAAGAPFGLAHIDVDIYSAVKYSQETVWPQMCPGGYLVYDDATTSSCLGATQAVEELIAERGIHSEQIWPHFVFRANTAQKTNGASRPGNDPQCPA